MMTAEEDKDPSIERIKQSRNGLRSLIQGQCPEADLLGNFIQKELDGKVRTTIEEHLDVCPMCLLAVQQLIQAEEFEDAEPLAQAVSWQEAEQHMDGKVHAYLQSIQESEAGVASPHRERLNPLQKLISLMNEVLTPSRLAYAGLAASVCIGTIYFYALFSRPDYFELARIQYESIGQTRGQYSQSEELLKGLESLEQGQYENAVRSLSELQKTHPDNYQVNFNLGLAYMLGSEKALLGLPYKFDPEQVRQAVESLTRASGLAEENQFYQEDCFWHLGKAYLMMNETEQAKRQFVKILNLKQPNLMRKAEAKEMLEKIAALESD